MVENEPDSSQTHNEALTGTIHHQASGPVSGLHKCAGTRSTQAEIWLPTSLERGKKRSRLTTLGRQSLLRLGGSAPVSHQNPRAPLPPWLLAIGGDIAGLQRRPVPWGPLPACQPSFPLFLFSPRPGGPWEPREALSLSLAVGLSRPAPPRVYAPKATFPMFPPWAMWVPVKSADFLPVDVAGSHIQENKRSVHTQRHAGWRPPLSPPMCLADGARSQRPRDLR